MRDGRGEGKEEGLRREEERKVRGERGGVRGKRRVV